MSCKKGSTKKTSDNNLGAINGAWENPSYGRINNNVLKWTVNSNGNIGIITELGSAKFGFTVGDQFLTDITLSGTGTYSAMGKYTYGTNNQSSGVRAAILTLQNNNTQIKVDFPAINASFPQIIYVYQKQ